MESITGRHWLWQFSTGAVALSVSETGFGRDIAEAFELWTAMQADTDLMVRNVADHLMEAAEEGASESDSPTVEVEKPKKTESSQDRASAARVEVTEEQEGTDGKDTSNSTQEESEKDRVSDEVRDGHQVEVAELEEEEVHATMYDSLPEGHDQALRDGLGAALCPGAPLAGEDGESRNVLANANEEMQLESALAGPVESSEDANMVVSAAGEESHADDLPPYQVPETWRRVLSAWNDPAIGAGLGGPSEPGQDSVVSNGEFEHEAAAGHNQADVDNQNDHAADAAGSSTSPTTIEGHY